MPLKCNDTAFLIDTVRRKHPDAAEKHPTATQHQFSFKCGLVMNIYNTGSVNFQGNSFENHIASDLINVIEMINRGQ